MTISSEPALAHPRSEIDAKRWDPAAPPGSTRAQSLLSRSARPRQEHEAEDKARDADKAPFPAVNKYDDNKDTSTVLDGRTLGCRFCASLVSSMQWQKTIGYHRNIAWSWPQPIAALEREAQVASTTRNRESLGDLKARLATRCCRSTSRSLPTPRRPSRRAHSHSCKQGRCHIIQAYAKSEAGKLERIGLNFAVTRLETHVTKE